MGIVHGGKLYLSLDDIDKDYVPTADLRKLVGEWRNTDGIIYGEYQVAQSDCADELECLLGGE